jgi:plastocyanin
MRARILSAAAVTAAAVSITVLAASGSQAAGTTTVAVKDFAFSPKTVTVRRGSTVTFVWKGKAQHDVTVISGPTRFHSPTQASGRWTTKRLTRKGTYRIECSIHSMVMRMTLKVR